MLCVRCCILWAQHCCSLDTILSYALSVWTFFSLCLIMVALCRQMELQCFPAYPQHCIQYFSKPQWLKGCSVFKRFTLYSGMQTLYVIIVTSHKLHPYMLLGTETHSLLIFMLICSFTSQTEYSAYFHAKTSSKTSIAHTIKHQLVI